MSLYTPKSNYKADELLDLSKSTEIRKIDYKLSKVIYDIFNKEHMKYVPVVFGLIPYELYILPGMFLAILQTLWLGTPNPVQFHLLPHWFAYSIFQLLKGAIKTYRPGCWIKGMGEYIDKSHCMHGHEFQSFPSGHTGICASLTTALFCEMIYSQDPQFFEISISDKNTRYIIAGSGIFVCILVALHRVSKGYHSLFDTITGMILGICIGFTSWSAMEYYKRRYEKLCSKQGITEGANVEEGEGLCDNYEYAEKDREVFYWLKDWSLFKTKVLKDESFNLATGITRIILSIPILYLTIKFFYKDVWNLASIKH